MRKRGTKELTELLSTYIEGLLQGHAEAVPLMELSPDVATEVGPLMELARELAEVLQPVRPREAYRAHLHRGLVEAAQRKLARQAATGHPQRIPRRQWMLGAAAVGSAVSVLGVIAYLIHSRHSRARQVLPS